MKKLLMITIIMILSTTAIFAQSVFIEKGENAFGGGALFTMDSDTFESGGQLGYSFNGIFDISLYVGVGKVDDDTMGDTGYFGIAPGVEYFFIKQNDEYPVSVSADFSLNYVSFFSDDLDALDWDVSSNGYSIGGNVYYEYELSEKISVIPSFGLEMIYTNVKIEPASGSAIENDETNLGIELAAPFKIKMKENFLLTIPVGISLVDGESMFMIGVNSINRF